MENLSKIIRDISIEHPSRLMEFDVLLNGIDNEIENGYINSQSHPKYPYLKVYKYSLKTVVERKWNVFTLMARGLILDTLNKKIVATPFVKFFNYNEIVEASELIESDYMVFEKVDGSMGILVNFNKEWIMSTLGSFTSEQAIWAGKWAEVNLNLGKMCKQNTYIFEIVYKENKIVIDYDFEGLVLLSIFDIYGLEYQYDMLKKESELLGVSIPKIYDFNDMNSIIENAKNLNYNHEGYVIRFKNGIRLKVKGDEYVRIHRLISMVTPLAIWESMCYKQDMNEISVQLPEEIRKDFWNIVSILKNKYDTLIDEIKIVVDKTSYMTDKELGLYFYKNKNAYIDGEFPDAKKYVFTYRKGSFFDLLENEKHPFRRNLFNKFRPLGNRLDGYVPSNVMNRFEDDA